MKIKARISPIQVAILARALIVTAQMKLVNLKLLIIFVVHQNNLKTKLLIFFLLRLSQEGRNHKWILSHELESIQTNLTLDSDIMPLLRS